MFRRSSLVLSACVIAAASLDAQSPGHLISTGELATLLQDPSVVVVHVAERESAFLDGHIPGARFLRYADFAPNGADDLGSELPAVADLKRLMEGLGVSAQSRVVLYGASPVAAARAFFTLDAAGHTRVQLLDGGLRAWRDEQRPIAKGAAQPVTPGQFTPQFDSRKVAGAQQIQQALTAKSIALVDVRPDPEFLGTDGGMGGAHAVGHIAGARQLTWNALVGADGKFLPRAELETKLQAAGAERGKPVVAYCMVGMRASVVYFVARHLGYDAKLYDGSIVDWSRRRLPTVTARL